MFKLFFQNSVESDQQIYARKLKQSGELVIALIVLCIGLLIGPITSSGQVYENIFENMLVAFWSGQDCMIGKLNYEAQVYEQTKEEIEEK